MLNADDPGTLIALRELRRAIQDSNRPLVLWVGAGASNWLGYPVWKELARRMRREFSKFVGGFDNAVAVKEIEANDFARFFQDCRDLDQSRYHRFLSNIFLPQPETPLYRRFADALGNMTPLRILTTNIDEALEQRFPQAGIFQRTDIAGCLEQLPLENSFIAKLHGSRSAIESAVFTRDDYKTLMAEIGYLSTLRQIFATGTVVFLGYSVSDQYVIDLLSDNQRDMSLFGAGPYFVVSSKFSPTSNLRRIQYSLKRFADHRSALQVLDFIRQAATEQIERPSGTRVEIKQPCQAVAALVPNDKTGYFISDLLSIGTWTASQTARFAGPTGINGEMTVGLGFTDDEFPHLHPSAAHDLSVGLICFDIVYVPFSALGKILSMLGDSFWKLMKADVIRVIHLQHEPAVVHTDDPLFGDLMLVALTQSTGVPEMIGTLIRRALKATPGREAEVEKHFSELEEKIILFDDGPRVDVPGSVRRSFLMPDVSRLLGVGEAILPRQIPLWLKFSCLRMAHLIQTGAVCDQLGIQAAKIPFGGLRLTSAAFGVQSPSESADHYASYVLSGRFNTDIGAALVSQPTILEGIMRFRETNEGEAFRSEVRDKLLTNDASELSASVNARIARNIPVQILEKARDQLSTLLTESVSATPVPAVWADSLQLDDSTRFWRAKSRQILLGLAKERGISGNDPCICGSGDKLGLCCLAPLRG